MENMKFIRVQISDLTAITSKQAREIAQLQKESMEISAELHLVSNKLIDASNVIEEMRYQLDKIKPAGYND